MSKTKLGWCKHPSKAKHEVRKKNENGYAFCTNLKTNGIFVYTKYFLFLIVRNLEDK
jgi:hypothetical protein